MNTVPKKNTNTVHTNLFQRTIEGPHGRSIRVQELRDGGADVTITLPPTFVGFRLTAGERALFAEWLASPAFPGVGAGNPPTPDAGNPDRTSTSESIDS